ncbi:HD domain-containing protein [candidate division WOR-3 bacterium]|nr:HD domain-containing protein [candidate division WOR-3 bacterium]
MKVIRDAVWGDIEINALEKEIIDTPSFQRLRKIRQLGCAHLVYPTALHTRFDHSLGTLHCASLIMQSIVKKGFTFEPEDKLTIRLAALLHDVTHIPFGHTLEDERRIFPRHDMTRERWKKIVSEKSIGSILGREGVDEKVESILFGESGSYPEAIVKGVLSADLLDYLSRDSYFCGLNVGYDMRVFRYFGIEDKKLFIELFKDGIFRHDAFSETVNLLRARYFMTERVYYHHSKIASSVMVSKAVEEALSSGFDPEKFLYMGDDEIIFEINNNTPNNKDAARILYLYDRRSLYKRCFIHQTRDLDDERARDLYFDSRSVRKKAEKKIAKRLRIKPSEIALYCPPPDMYLKEIDVPVSVRGKKLMKLSEMDNPDIKTLEYKHRQLWKICLFISPDSEDLAQKAGEICAEEIGLKNELPKEKTGQLSLWTS